MKLIFFALVCCFTSAYASEFRNGTELAQSYWQKGYVSDSPIKRVPLPSWMEETIQASFKEFEPFSISDLEAICNHPHEGRLLHFRIRDGILWYRMCMGMVATLLFNSSCF